MRSLLLGLQKMIWHSMAPDMSSVSRAVRYQNPDQQSGWLSHSAGLIGLTDEQPGDNIERENRREGTGGKPLCSTCAGLA